MKAKDMFEREGFKNTLKNDVLLIYERYIESRNNFYSESVKFNLKDKTLSIINIDEITMPLLQAINQQMKEIGDGE